MIATVLCRGLLMAGLALGLASCLTSDPPKLDLEDLTMPAGFAGSYFASRFPVDPTDAPNTIDAVVEPAGDRSYQLTFQEGDHKDEPVVVRLLTLNSGTLLAVFSDPKPDSRAVYAVATIAANGAWVFRMIELKADSRGRVLRDALQRHGVAGAKFDSSDQRNDELQGTLSAANLRALMSDPDFVNAIDLDTGFRLSPKH